jgi:hypothetical protein
VCFNGRIFVINYVLMNNIVFMSFSSEELKK